MCSEACSSPAATRSSGGPPTAEAFQSLRALETELAHALAELSHALSDFRETSGTDKMLEAKSHALVLAGDRVQAALADPVRALRVDTIVEDDEIARASAENAPRRAAMMARAIRTRELSMLDVWFASLGPIASGLIEAAVEGAVRRTPAAAAGEEEGRAQADRGL